MSMGRQEAFETFKRDYAGNEEIEEQKQFLKRSYGEAKILGELINASRSKLSEFLTQGEPRHIQSLTFFRPPLDTIKSKCEQVYAKLEAMDALDDQRQTAEYESLRKKMEIEKEK